MSLALFVCLLFFATASVLFRTTEKSTRTVFATVEKARAQLAASPLRDAGTAMLTMHANFESPSWPLRTYVNEVVRNAGEAAQAQGISLRAISVLQQESSAHALGRVALDVSASGRYPALKAWQSVMQKQYPSLAVHSLRLRGNESSSVGDLNAEVTWVLYVRD